MKHMLIKFVTSTAALMLVSNLLSGVSVKNWSTAIIAVLVMGAVNAVLKPVLGLLTLPINFLTFGLFSFVLNAAMFGLSAYFVPGFEVHGFMSALLGCLLYGAVATILLWILEWVVAPNKPAAQLEQTI
jgi:putative membrane protein